MHSANPSLSELKRESEQTRASLTQTVERLRTGVSETAGDIRKRLSPESIEAGVSDYVRSRGERLVEDVTAAARRNPMQAVALGASIAGREFGQRPRRRRRSLAVLRSPIKSPR